MAGAVRPAGYFIVGAGRVRNLPGDFLQAGEGLGRDREVMHDVARPAEGAIAHLTGARIVALNSEMHVPLLVWVMGC